MNKVKDNSIIKFAYILFFIALAMLCINSLSAQKPTPTNDTFSFSGTKFNADLFKNDQSGYKYLTSFKIGTKSYLPNKTTLINGYSLTIDSFGKLSLSANKDTFTGQFPAIRYIINNGTGDGKGANIYITVTKSKPIVFNGVFTSLYKQNGQLFATNGTEHFKAIPIVTDVQGMALYFVIVDGRIPIIIDEFIYNLLK